MMYSFKKNKSFLPLVIIPLFLVMNNCSDRSEYGGASDYEKLGAAATTGACTNGEDTTAPTISSVSPIDNSTYYISVATTVAVTFSKKMATSSVTTNTSDTTCSGSFQLSSDNFTSCIKMSAAPVASDNDTIFTITPASSLSAATTYKTKITTSVKDISCNTLGSAYTIDNGFITSPSAGSGTIKGSVINYSGSSALSGVNVSYALSEKTLEDAATTDNSGDFAKSSLAAGTYTLTYEKDGYENETQSATLATDSQTLTVSALKMLSTSSCASTGVVSGKITDAVNGTDVSGVSISIRRGKNRTSGAVYAAATTTNGSGVYSFSNVARGWYTLQTSKSSPDYIDSTFNVISCGNISNQDSSISTALSSNAMRIILTWPSSTVVDDLDSHLKIPDNSSGSFHIYYPVSKEKFYYATNSNSCGSCTSSQLSDNVSLDWDARTSPGTETITISQVRSGTYSYSVHDFDNKDLTSPDNMSTSGATVTIYYNDTVTSYTAPNSSGSLWTVFTFTSGSFVEVGTMSDQSTEANIY